MNSKPCSMCREMILTAGIKSVIYSNDKGNLTKIKAIDLDGSHKSTGIRHLEITNREYLTKKINQFRRSISK